MLAVLWIGAIGFRRRGRFGFGRRWRRDDDRFRWWCLRFGWWRWRFRNERHLELGDFGRAWLGKPLLQLRLGRHELLILDDGIRFVAVLLRQNPK